MTGAGVERGVGMQRSARRARKTLRASYCARTAVLRTVVWSWAGVAPVEVVRLRSAQRPVIANLRGRWRG